MPCAVIQILHLMVGVDIHTELVGVPPAVVTVPTIPHAVFSTVGHPPGYLIGTVKASLGGSGNVLVNFVKMPMILQGSDMGFMIPHIPLLPCFPALLPLIMLGSGSATEFCAFSVKANGKAVANAPFVLMALNMNCGFPPTPGIVIAPSLVFTGFRIGDFIAGMVGLLMDAALSAAISIAFGGLSGSGGLMGLIKGPLGGPIIKNLFTGIIQLGVGSFGGLGSPLGYSNDKSTLLGGGFKKNSDDEHGRVGSGWGALKENVQNGIAEKTRKATTAVMDYFTAP